MLIDAFLLVDRGIKERKTRSILTILGIAAGIASLILLMSLGYGMQESITSQLVEMGDTIMVMPGEMRKHQK